MTEPSLPTLHLVFSRAGYAALQPVLAAAAEPFSVALLQDACYLLADRSWELPDTCYALEDDLALRGLTGTDHGQVSVISQAELVALCCNHLPLVSWA